MLEQIKIEIKSSEQSKAVQEVAFSLGYKWQNGDIKILDIGHNFLYLLINGYLNYGGAWSSKRGCY